MSCQQHPFLTRSQQKQTKSAFPMTWDLQHGVWGQPNGWQALTKPTVSTLWSVKGWLLGMLMDRALEVSGCYSRVCICSLIFLEQTRTVGCVSRLGLSDCVDTGLKVVFVS